MALLINKLFSSRKKAHHKHQDACERAFTFSQDQVRVVLFRECDFRGRKLLFDSQSVQKVPVAGNRAQPAAGTPAQSSRGELFVETSNGYGYQYTRPAGDTVQLGEMVFGSVAMSFRGTSLKIHSFSSPAKLMCTQVFPSPRHPVRGRSSMTSCHFVAALRPNGSVQSFERSAKLEYSSASSTASFNEQGSVYSAESDARITTPSGSVPLDVPASSASTTNAKLAPSLEGDSGFCGEQSYSSVSSGPPSMCVWDTRPEHGSVHGFSCGSLYKRWLRSASTSLDYNACSDGYLSGVHCSASADECMARAHHRSSKLGLAVIIRLSEGQEIDLERFLLEHSALLEAMVCRARAGAEAAYTKPGSFASLMCETVQEAGQWLTDLVTGPTVGVYLWHALGTPPPRHRRSAALSEAVVRGGTMPQTKSESSLAPGDRTRRPALLLSGSLLEIDRPPRLCATDFLRLDERCTGAHADRFVRDLCELLESVDTKHTNFFVSTLLTAVLTNHLGWVATVLPPSQSDRDTLAQLHAPCNPLWGQLSDLYGAVGSPTKLCHTVVCGSNKNEIIGRILHVLTYFIRCSVVERNFLCRYAACEEHVAADKVCLKGEHSSAGHYVGAGERYGGEHRRPAAAPGEELELAALSTPVQGKTAGLTRTRSCLGSLGKQLNVDEDTRSSAHPLLDKVTSLGIGADTSPDRLKNGFKVLDCFQAEDRQHLVGIEEASDQIRKVFHPKPVPVCPGDSCAAVPGHVEPGHDVVFVLGEDERLVGLRKCDNNNEQRCAAGDRNIPGCSRPRPTHFHVPLAAVFASESSDSSPDTLSCRSSSSETSPCSECEKQQRARHTCKQRNGLVAAARATKVVMTRSSVISLETEAPGTDKCERRRDEFNRSQSVPPSDKQAQRRCSKSGCKKKYSGVRFDFKQYPQIATNYMRSKNLFAEKSLKLSRSFSASLYDCTKFEVPSCDCEPHSGESLQTPSNASELAFTSELVHEPHRARERVDRRAKAKGAGGFEHPLQEAAGSEDNAIFEHDIDTYEREAAGARAGTMTFVELPMPRILGQQQPASVEHCGYTQSLLRGVSGKYVSDMVLQGTTCPVQSWQHVLKRDLALAARQPLLDQPVQEALAIVANTDTWEVQLVSSHTYVVERGSAGVRVGMSQLIANMLESLLHMWKLRTPPEYCLMHIESRLREFCVRSKALAHLLMTTEFCNMDLLTSTLQLEVNDVPLLMSVASTHTPQVTQKYGLSFQ